MSLGRVSARKHTCASSIDQQSEQWPLELCAEYAVVQINLPLLYFYQYAQNQTDSVIFRVHNTKEILHRIIISLSIPRVNLIRTKKINWK